MFNWMKHEGHLVPAEIVYHIRAASFDKQNVIVKPLTWMEKRSSFVLVMEFLEDSMDLFDLVKNHGPLNEEAASIIFGQIVEMVITLNEAGLCHRDIKDENIVICPKTLNVKLIDFGCATELSEGVSSDFSGTPEFYPPEFWRNRNFTHKGLNSWSVGIVLYILLVGKLPFENVNQIGHFAQNDSYYKAAPKTVKKSNLACITMLVN